MTPSASSPHFQTIIYPMGHGVDMSLNDIRKHEEMRACKRLLDPTLAVHGRFLAVFLLIPHSHCLEVRAREGEGESETSQAGDDSLT